MWVFSPDTFAIKGHQLRSAWLDVVFFVASIKKQKGYKVAYLRRTVLNHGWLSKDQVQLQPEQLKENSYDEYLNSLLVGA